MSMQPPGQDPNPDRSFLAQLIMNLFNRGQPFGGGQGGSSAGNAGMFPAAPGSGMSGLFPAAPAGPPTDMSVAGPWGAGIDPGLTGGTGALPPTPTPRPQVLPQQGAPTPTARPPQAKLRLNRGQY